MKYLKLSCRLMALVGLFSFSSAAVSAPLMQTVTGDCTQGGQIRISGSDLGASALPAFWDAVDNLQGYSTIGDGGIVPDLYWKNGYFSYDNPVRIETSSTLPGSSKHYRGAQKSKLYWAKALSSRNLRKIYVSWYYRPSVDPAGNGGSNKFIRVWDDPQGNGTRVSWTSMHMTYNSTSGPDAGVAWGSFNGRVGGWNLMEIWIDKDTHRIETMINGVPRHTVTNFLGAENVGGLNVYLIGFDPSESSRYPSMITDMDNIYISGTKSRIEITNNTSWKATDRRAVQIPTSWTSTTIDLRLNQGEVGLSNAYLHYIDAGGVARSTVRLACSGTPSKPAAPTLQLVSP